MFYSVVAQQFLADNKKDMPFVLTLKDPVLKSLLELDPYNKFVSKVFKKCDVHACTSHVRVSARRIPLCLYMNISTINHKQIIDYVPHDMIRDTKQMFTNNILDK